MGISKVQVVPVGGTKRAVATLKSIVNRDDIDIPIAIIMPGYENEKLYSEQLVDICKSNTIDYILSDKITTEHIASLSTVDIDVMLGIGVWRSILSEAFLSLSKVGYLGLHGTPLPKYRGWAGINWQIINGHKSVQMRALRLENGIDDGALVCDGKGELLHYEIDIDNDKHLQEIFEEYEELHLRACHDMIDLVASNEISYQEQNEEEASYSCHRGEEDGDIDWTDSTNEIFNFIRAQSHPYKGAFTYFLGQKIHIHRVAKREDYHNYQGRIYGKVAKIDKQKGSVIILTGDSALEILATKLSFSDEEVSPSTVFNSVRARCKNKVENYADLMEERFK